MFYSIFEINFPFLDKAKRLVKTFQIELCAYPYRLFSMQRI